MHILKAPLMLNNSVLLSLNLMVVALTYSVLQLTKKKGRILQDLKGTDEQEKVWKEGGKHLSCCLSPGGTVVCAVGWEVLLHLRVPSIAPQWAVHVWQGYGLFQPLSSLICRSM